LEHSILIIAYPIIQRKEPYHDLDGDYFDKRRPEATPIKLVKRLEHLGFQVALQKSPVPLAV
jgi:hypothetical protein